MSKSHVIYLLFTAATYLLTTTASGQTDADGPRPTIKAGDTSWERFFEPPSTSVRPFITYPSHRDRDGDRILDTLAPKLVPGAAAHTLEVVVTLYEEPTRDDVLTFFAHGGELHSVWRHATYGIWGTIPADRVAALAATLGPRLCIIKEAEMVSGVADMDVAPEIVQVRNRVWNTYGYTGDAEGSIAILDNGLSGDHNDLADHDNDNAFDDPGDWWNACASGWNSSYHTVGWFNEYNSTANPVEQTGCSGEGHGTAASGCAAGDGSGNSNYKGVAPSSHLVGVRIGRCATYPPQDAIDGMNTMVANRMCARIKVANISVSYVPNDPTDLMDAASNVVRNGIVFTCSAGNGWDEGPGSEYYEVVYPGLNDKLITVGATNDDDAMAGYSSHGPANSSKPDIVAPGGSYWQGSGWINAPDNRCPSGCPSPYDQYQERTGTSFAAPIVAGAASLVIDAWEQANATSWGYTEAEALWIKGILLMTAVEIDSTGEDPDGSQPANSPGPKDRGGHDLVEGYGRLNVDAAVEAVSMWMCDGEVASDSLGDASTDKKVWARRLVTEGNCIIASLDVPATGDFDLYIYDDFPDTSGIPTLLDQSVDPNTGQDEQIQLAVGADDTMFVVVKWVSGHGDFTIDLQTYPRKQYVDSTHDIEGNRMSGLVVAWSDYDHDNDEDLFMGGRSGTGTGTIFRNDGSGTLWKVQDIVGPSFLRNATWGDFDGDGDEDIYVVGGVPFGTPDMAKNRLYRNDSGSFTDISTTLLGTNLATLTTTDEAEWVDYDGDGDLDVYIALDDMLILPYPNATNQLLRNDGTIFTSVGASVGLDDNEITRGTAWGDYDNDGDPDVYNANFDATKSKLFRNDGVAGFVEVTHNALGGKGACTDAMFVDYDNDGDLDLFVVRTNSLDVGDCQLFENSGSPSYTFTDVTPTALRAEGQTLAATWVDIDNDTDLDVFVAGYYGSSRLLLNKGAQTGIFDFVDGTIAPFDTLGDGDDVAVADYDREGFMEPLFAQQPSDSNQLYQALDISCPTQAMVAGAASASGQNKWLQIHPRTANGSTAIGSRVQVYVGGIVMMREVNGDGRDSPTAEFGLGPSTSVDSVVISWGDGGRTTLLDLPVSSRYIVVDGDDTPVGAGSSPLTTALHHNYPNPFNPSTSIRFDLATKTVVHLTIYDVAGRLVRRLEDGKRRRAGTHVISWDGTNDAGVRVASGIYFCRLKVPGFTQTRRLVLLK